MSLTDKEREGFEKVINEILLPIIHEHKDDIEKIVNDNPEFKEKVEEKVNKIIENRKRKTMD